MTATPSLEDLYGDYTDEAAEEEAKKFKKKWLKLDIGANIIRILPPPRNPETRQLLRTEPWLVMFEHQVRFPAGTLRVACPRVMNEGAVCPICVEVKRRKDAGNVKDVAVAKDMDVRRKVYVEAISRKDPASGVMLLETGSTVHNDLLRLRRDNVAGGIDFTHPIKGYDVNIHKESTGPKVTNVKYTCALARKSTPLAETKEQMIEWLTTRIDFTEKKLIPTAEEILQMIAEKKEASRDMPRSQGGEESRESLPAATSANPEDDFDPIVSSGDADPNDDKYYPADPGDDDIPF